tara:strand:+ start:1735 stop:1896 length:162 start_codon:yes stop_codon:yes gene_type:complete
MLFLSVADASIGPPTNRRRSPAEREPHTSIRFLVVLSEGAMMDTTAAREGGTG